MLYNYAHNNYKSAQFPRAKSIGRTSQKDAIWALISCNKKADNNPPEIPLQETG